MVTARRTVVVVVTTVVTIITMISMITVIIGATKTTTTADRDTYNNNYTSDRDTSGCK